MRQPGTARILRVLAASLGAVYLLWNLAWWAHGDVAPSLFSSLTSLPCPTTGGTRAFACLLRGDLAGSLHYNAMMIPLTILFLGTVWGQLARWLAGKRLVMPRWSVTAWGALLAVAWILKLASDPVTW